MEKNIAMKIANLKRLTRTFVEDCREFSLLVALGRLIKDLPILPWEKRRTFYENRVSAYLENRYGHIITDYKPASEPKPAEQVIWVMWWQGEQNMPPIVKACYDQLRKVAKQKIVLITETNYTQYVNIPDYILEKHARGYITTTHLSDIIRVELLRTRGGLWMDATIYAASIPDEIFEHDFYTLHAPGMFPEFIGRGNWSTFLLYSGKTATELFSLLYKLYLEYWKDHKSVVDYLLFDYFLNSIVKQKPTLEQVLSSIPVNARYYGFNLSLDEAFNREKIYAILKESPLQKLTYKKVCRTSVEFGSETLYARIITGRLEYE